MLVVKDQGLLDELVIAFQLVNVVLIVNDVVFILLQLIHLVFQGSGDLDGAPSNFLMEAGIRDYKGNGPKEAKRAVTSTLL